MHVSVRDADRARLSTSMLLLSAGVSGPPEHNVTTRLVAQTVDVNQSHQQATELFGSIRQLGLWAIRGRYNQSGTINTPTPTSRLGPAKYG
ncbi:hypothetical protein J6590_060951 [Homalodisca vitripennis]|nr:hypothetical protein J6590_060951 [Homalodisca vitripennis]